MGVNVSNLFQQLEIERVSGLKATRDAAQENNFRKLPRPTSSRNDIPVHNLSSKELTMEQVQVLWHEASLNTAEAKPVKVIAAVESDINQMGVAEETKNLIRHQVLSYLMANKPCEILLKFEPDALQELKADRDIVPTDKGRSTVVLDRIDYLQKVKNLLDDCQFYVSCETNHVKSCRFRLVAPNPASFQEEKVN
uniref:Uncharacterized protein n=1 Tax=Schistocephalus solidus TaxID=70667 RepID=A0A0V0JAQ7_SCHSO